MLSRRAALTRIGAAAALASAPLRAAAAAARDPWEPDAEYRVPADGGSLYVRVNGNLAGPRGPLLVIGGGPGDPHAFCLPLLALADERAVILYDQLDAGLSDRPGDPRNWTPARFGAEPGHIRRVLGIERWHGCGLSWGGTVALEYASHEAAALASVALWSPLVSTRDWLADAAELRAQLPPATRKVLRRCETRASFACEAAGGEYNARYLIRTAPDPRIGAWIAAHPPLGQPSPLYPAMWGPSEFRATGTLRNYDGTPLLAHLPAGRTLFLGGQYDEARPETLARYAARVPGAEWAVLPGSGHAGVVDRPAEAIALLRGWMERHDTAGRVDR